MKGKSASIHIVRRCEESVLSRGDATKCSSAAPFTRRPAVASHSPNIPLYLHEHIFSLHPLCLSLVLFVSIIHCSPGPIAACIYRQHRHKTNTEAGVTFDIYRHAVPSNKETTNNEAIHEPCGGSWEPLLFFFDRKLCLCLPAPSSCPPTPSLPPAFPYRLSARKRQLIFLC